MTKRVGVIGGGQLARMMIAPASELGIEIRVLAEQDGMSAALAATATGDYRDLETVRAFAPTSMSLRSTTSTCRSDVLRALIADGTAVHPGPDALQYAQDKLVMRAEARRDRRPAARLGRRLDPRGAAGVHRRARRSCAS